MITSARIDEDLKPAGLDWISCAEARRRSATPRRRAVAAVAVRRTGSGRDQRPDDFPGERLVVAAIHCWPTSGPRKRSALLEATERIEGVAEAVAGAGHGAVIGLQVGAVIDKL